MTGGLAIGQAHAVRALLNGVAYTLVLPRLLTPDDFGVVAIAVATIGWLSFLRDPGLSWAIVQRRDLTDADRNTLVWMGLGLGLTISLAMALAAPALAGFYDDPRLVGIVLWLAVAGLLETAAVMPRATLMRDLRFRSLAVIEIASVMAQVGSAVGLGLRQAGYWALIAGRVAPAAVRTIGCWASAGWRPGRPGWSAGAPALLRFGRNVTGFNLVNYLSRNLDDIAVGKLFGSAPLGLYRRAYDLYLLPRDQIGPPLGRIAIPALSSTLEDPPRYRDLYIRLVRVGLAIGVPVSVFVLVSADELLPLLFGPGWEGAVPVLRALSLLMVLESAAHPTGWLFMSQGRTGDMFQWGVVSAALSVGAIVTGIPWGPVGIATAFSLVGALVRTPLLFWWAGRTGPVTSRDLFALPLPFLAAGASAALAALGVRGLSLAPAAASVALTLAATAVGALVGTAILPGGGRLLRDLRETFRALRAEAPAEELG